MVLSIVLILLCEFPPNILILLREISSCLDDLAKSILLSLAPPISLENLWMFYSSSLVFITGLCFAAGYDFISNFDSFCTDSNPCRANGVHPHGLWIKKLTANCMQFIAFNSFWYAPWQDLICHKIIYFTCTSLVLESTTVQKLPLSE